MSDNYEYSRNMDNAFKGFKEASENELRMALSGYAAASFMIGTMKGLSNEIISNLSTMAVMVALTQYELSRRGLPHIFEETDQDKDNPFSDFINNMDLGNL